MKSVVVFHLDYSLKINRVITVVEFEKKVTQYHFNVFVKGSFDILELLELSNSTGQVLSKGIKILPKFTRAI